MSIKILKTVSFIFFTTFTFWNSSAQFNINSNPYWQGEIQMLDGTVKKGFIQVPNISGENKIAFKISKDGHDENVQRQSISSLKVVSETGNEYQYENVNVGGVKSDKKTKKMYLLFVQAKNEFVTFYVMSTYSANNKDGKIYLVDSYAQGKDFPTFFHYIKKRDSEKANMFYATQQLGGIKKDAELNFAEDPELVKKMKKGELGKKDIPEIISTFLKTTEGM